MLQLRKVRFHTPAGETEPKKYDSPLTPDIVVKDLPHLLDNLDSILKEIPKAERFNLFCTVGHVAENGEKSRSWASQDMLFFDIDGIDIKADGSFEEEKYLQAISKALKVPTSKMVVIYSGHGFHVLIKTKKPWSDKTYFNKNRGLYNSLCTKINTAIKDYGLAGATDRGVFAPGFMLRLPSTLNKKPGRDIFEVRVLTKNLEPIEFDFKKVLGIPDIPESDQMSEKELTYFKIDSPSVEDQCLFLKDMKQSGGDVDEPLWYAALSIVGRLANGKELAHEYSRGHRSYTVRDTEHKVEQAVQNAGPRTCDSINSLWGGCGKCPHYKKVKSPISIKGAGFIATAHSGFHILGKKGSLVPQFEDLRKHYDKELPYLNVDDTHYRYKETHWEEVKDVFIDNFAQENFHPPAKNNMCAEFRGLVKRTNLGDRRFFTTTTDRKINLKNGVLNIDTMELTDHDPIYGFKQTLDFGYDPQATCPTFDKMLDGVTCGDRELQDNLLQFMGYAISNDVPRADKILVLTGEGQNGKSRFLNILRALAGDGATNLGVKDLTNPFHRQMLDGSLLNITEEMPPFVRKEFWEDVKSLASGGLVTASRKFKHPYSFFNRSKLIMTCNKLPPGTDPTHGFFRRLAIVGFNATFSHELGNIDTNIDQRIIESELPGVLNLVLKAHKQLVAADYKFTDSKAMDMELNSYKREPKETAGEPPEWMNRGADGRFRALIPAMRTEYAQWSDAQGEKAVSSINFGRRLLRWAKEQENKAELADLAVPDSSGSGSGCEAETPKVEYKKVSVCGKKVNAVFGVRWSSDAEY